jgi:hypothetical protein
MKPFGFIFSLQFQKTATLHSIMQRATITAKTAAMVTEVAEEP